MARRHKIDWTQWNKEHGFDEEEEEQEEQQQQQTPQTGRDVVNNYIQTTAEKKSQKEKEKKDQEQYQRVQERRDRLAKREADTRKKKFGQDVWNDFTGGKTRRSLSEQLPTGKSVRGSVMPESSTRAASLLQRLASDIYDIGVENQSQKTADEGYEMYKRAMRDSEKAWKDEERRKVSEVTPKATDLNGMHGTSGTAKADGAVSAAFARAQQKPGAIQAAKPVMQDVANRTGITEYNQSMREAELVDFYDRMANAAAETGNEAQYNHAAAEYDKWMSSAAKKYISSINQFDAYQDEYIKENHPAQYYADTMNEDELRQKHQSAKGYLVTLDQSIADIERQMENVRSSYGGAYGYDVTNLDLSGDSEYQKLLAVYSNLREERETAYKENAVYEAAVKIQDQRYALQKREEYSKYGGIYIPANGSEGAQPAEPTVPSGSAFLSADPLNPQITADPTAFVTQWSEDPKVEAGRAAYEDPATGMRGDLLRRGKTDPVSGEYSRLTLEDRKIFYAMYADDPQGAMEWAKTMNEMRDDEYFAKMSEYVGETSPRRAAGLLAGSFARLISGLDPFGEWGQEMSKTGEAILSGGAAGQTKYGPFGIEKLSGTVHLGPLGDVGFGNLYSIAGSMIESGMIALPAMAAGGLGAKEATVKIIEAFGTILMGSSAAATDYRERVKAGWSERDAMAHALWTGIAEAGFEYVSLDKLVNPEATKSLLLRTLQQAGIEGSEEMCTTIANRITDGALARKNGYDTSVDERAKELMAEGYSYDAAYQKADQEWFSELLNDTVGGMISGGAMGGMRNAPMAVSNKYNQYQANKFERYSLAYNAQIDEENVGALDQYAKDNKIKLDTEAATAQDVSKKTQDRLDRKMGKGLQEVRSTMTEQMTSAGSVQGAEQVYSQLVEQYGDGIRGVADQSLTEAVSRISRGDVKQTTATKVLEHRDTVNEFKDERAKTAAKQGLYKSAMEAAMETNTAEDAKAVMDYARNKGEKMSMAATVETRDGNTKQVGIVGFTKNMDSVVLADGSTVAYDSLQTDADTKDVLDIMRSSKMSEEAVVGMMQAYDNAKENGLSDPYRWANDYVLTYNRGQVESMKIDQAVTLAENLTAEEASQAYRAGQKDTGSVDAAYVAKQEQRMKNVKPGVTGRKGTLLVGGEGEISQARYDELANDGNNKVQFDAIRMIAEAAGLPVHLFETTADSKGNLTREQGRYQKGEIWIDVNGGLNNIHKDMNRGMLAVTGHELTHWMREYANKEYNAYKQAVRDVIISEVGSEGLERMVREQMARNKSLDWDGALEEVIADSGMTRMGDAEFWQALGEKLGDNRKTVMQKITDFVKKFFNDIRRALGLTSHTSEAAQIVDRAEAAARKAVAEAYAEGFVKAAENYQAAMQDAEAVGASAQMAEEAILKQSSRIDEETLEFLDDQDHVTVYRAMQMIDGQLYPPMAAKVKGEDGKTRLVEPTEIGKWYQAVERPDLIDPKTGKWKLNKGNGSSISAAYNPYFHSSASPLNDQFSSAYNRPNLVVVEGIIPKSELTSGYKAQYAKDSVGETKWHSGPVAGQLRGDKARRVFLSRWFQAVRVLSDTEVAGMIAKTLQGENVAIPSNVVTPSLLEALRKAGVAIDDTGIERFEAAHQGKKNTAPEGARLSIRPEAKTEIGQILAGQERRESVVLTDSTPSIMLGRKGVRDLPLAMKPTHIRENILTEEQAQAMGLKTGDGTNYHGLGEDLFYAVIDGLNDVTEAYRGTNNAASPERRENYFLLISKCKDADGNPINVPVYINTTSEYNQVYIDTNTVATVFGKKNFREYIARQVKRGDLVRIKKQGTATSERLGPIPSDYSDDASGTRIPQNGTGVKPQEGRKSSRDYVDYNRTVVLEESTVDAYLKDYADKSSPNYAKAFMVYMKPMDFLNLTASTVGALRVMNETAPLDVAELKKYNAKNPFRLRYDPKTGEIVGHEGRHRAYALRRELIENIPVVLIDISDNRSKTALESLTLHGQNFGTSRSNATVTVYDAQPLSYANRDTLIQKFSTQPKNEAMAEKYGIRETIRYSTRDTSMPSDVDLIEGLDESQADTQEGKAILKDAKKSASKLDELRGKLAEARKNAKAWENKAHRNADVMGMAMRSKNQDISNLEKEIQRYEKILAGQMRSPALTKMLNDARRDAAKEASQHKEEVYARAKERKRTTDIRNRVKNLHEEMRRELVKPREGHYVPKELTGPVLDLLEMISTDTGRAKSESAQAKIDAINAAYDRIRKDNATSMYYDETVKDMLTELSGTLQGRSIYELNADELTDVYTALKAMRTTIRNAIKADLIEKGKTIWDIGSRMIDELRNSKGEHRIGILESWHKAQLSPKRAFNRFGGYMPNSAWNKAYDMLDKAQQKMLMLEMQGTRIFDPVLKSKKDFKAAKELTAHGRNDLVDVGLKDGNGNPVLITKGMMLSLYMHLQNEDNMRHLMYGGLTLPGLSQYYDGKGDAWGAKAVSIPALGARVSNLDALLQTEGEEAVKARYAAEEQEVREMFESIRTVIEDSLTPYERKWIAAATEFFDGFSRRELNKATNSMYGFSKARVNNYFPIATDSDFLNTDIDTIKRDVSLENAGFMKERVRASNPILLEDITKVVNRQITKVAQYAGLTESLKTFDNIYKVKQKGFVDGVKKALHSTFGDKGQGYVENLLSDMVGGRSQPASIFDRVKGNYAQAILTLNLPVMVKQAASFPTAAAVTGWTPIVKALVKGGKSGLPISRANRSLIDTYSPLLWYRAQGAIDTELGDVAQKKGWLARQRWAQGIQKIDLATVGRLWSVAEYYVQDHFKGLEKGTQEQIDSGESPFYQKVGEVFSRIVEETQPNYTVLQRPDILRNPDKIIRAMTMFSTQRLQNANILIDSVATYNAVKQYDKKTKTAESKAMRKEAKTNLTRAISSQIASAVVLVAMDMVGKALLHRVNPFRDDDDELTWESIGEYFIESLFETMTGSFLWGSETFKVVNSILTGSKYYENDVGGISTVNSLLSGFVDLAQKATKMYEGDNTPTADDWLSLLKKEGWNLAKPLAQMTGMPVENVQKLLNAGYYHAIDAANGQILSFESGLKRSQKTNVNRYMEAWTAGDEAKMDSVLAEMKRNYLDDGKDEEKADELMRNAIGKAALEKYNAEEMDLQGLSDFMERTGLWTDEKRQDKLTDVIRDDYKAGLMTQEDVISALVDLAGFDEDKAWKTANEWEGKNAHADDEEYSYNQYEDLTDALAGGASFDEAAAPYLEHGYEEKNVRKAAGEYLEKVYKAGEITEDEAIQRLMEYKGFDENKAWKTVQEWTGEIEHADEEGYRYHQYDAIDEAIDQNKDIKTLVKDMTDHGIKESNVTEHVRDYLIDRYAEGNVTEAALKNQIARYCGITVSEDVQKIVRDANCKKATGYKYDSMDEAYRAGKISKAQMKNALIKYGGLDEETADKKIRYWDVKIKHPDLEIDDDYVNSYYDGTKTSNEYGYKSAEKAGVPISVYAEAKPTINKMKGTDRNGDGRSDTYTQEANRIAYIDSLNLSDDQKRALYFEYYTANHFSGKNAIARPSWLKGY